MTKNNLFFSNVPKQVWLWRLIVFTGITCIPNVHLMYRVLSIPVSFKGFNIDEYSDKSTRNILKVDTPF